MDIAQALLALLAIIGCMMMFAGVMIALCDWWADSCAEPTWESSEDTIRKIREYDPAQS